MSTGAQVVESPSCSSSQTKMNPLGVWVSRYGMARISIGVSRSFLESMDLERRPGLPARCVVMKGSVPCYDPTQLLPDSCDIRIAEEVGRGMRLERACLRKGREEWELETQRLAPPMVARSQALANRHSRFTALGDIFMTAAISSMLSPAKYFSSTS